MSLCGIPRALDRLLSSKVSLIIPISLNRALCLRGVGARMDQTESKKFDLQLFLAGR